MNRCFLFFKADSENHKDIRVCIQILVKITTSKLSKIPDLLNFDKDIDYLIKRLTLKP